MNTYKIYQVKPEYYRSYGYSSIASLRRQGLIQTGTPELNRDIWNEVYVFQMARSEV